MIPFLRFFFWPILLAAIAVGAWLLKLPIWAIGWAWFMEDPLDRIVLFLTIWFIWTIFKASARFLYAVYQSRNLLTLRVLLPRNDSKIDEEKRTEKDWKEKIAVMPIVWILPKIHMI